MKVLFDTVELAWPWILTVVSVLFYLLVLVAIGSVLRRRAEPMAMLAWVLILAFLPVVGLLFWVLLGEPRIRRKTRRRLRRRTRVEGLSAARADASGTLDDDEPEISPTWDRIPEPLRDLARLADRFASRPLTDANCVHVYSRPQETYDAILAAIEAARHHIHFEYYIFRSDETGALFRDALARKAAEGVEVRLLLDGVGSWGTGRRFFRPLLAAGGRLATYAPAIPLRRKWNINYRNHRKIVVVDGEVAFTGSQNIGDEYRGIWRRVAPWKDTHLRIEGPAVRHLQEVFIEDWLYAADESLRSDDYSRPLGCGGESPVQIIASGFDSPQDSLQSYIFLAISLARRRVRLSTPYFVPNEALLAALEMAARRGVEVELLIPAKTDNRIVLWAGRSYYRELLDAGVRVFEAPDTMLHSKVVTVDGQWALVGSANMDVRSFSLNFEISVSIFDPSICATLDADIEADLAAENEIHRWPPEDAGPLQSLVEGLARIGSPVL